MTRRSLAAVALCALCAGQQAAGFFTPTQPALLAARPLRLAVGLRGGGSRAATLERPGAVQLQASNPRSKSTDPPKVVGLIKLEHAYLATGLATAASWAACALGALATYKPWRYTHNTIGVLQALTALPLIWACFHSLVVGSRDGMLRMRQADCRRLNLGLAAASCWMAITVVFAPAFTSALVRTVDPVVYPIPLQGKCGCGVETQACNALHLYKLSHIFLLPVAAVATHLGTAALCLSTWRGSVMRDTPSRIVSGVLGTNWKVDRSDDPDQAPLYANEYSLASLAFAVFTALAIFAPFPLATIPSLLGKRMARAFGAWTLVAAVMLYELKGAAQEGRLGKGCNRCPTCFLKTGILLFTCSHGAVGAARLALESTSVYPAALACVPALVASLLVYFLAGSTAFRDMRFSAEKRKRQAESANTSRLQAEDCAGGQNI